MQITIDMSDINRVVGLATSVFGKKVVTDCLITAVARTMYPEAISILRKNDNINRGALVNSVRVRGGTGTRPEVQFGSFGVKYADAIEKGGRPHTPPFAPIYQWVIEKIDPENPIAFTRAVIRTIERRGTRAYPFIVPAVSSKREDMKQTFLTCLLKELNRSRK